MNDLGHTKDECALCRAVESMKQDEERVQKAWLTRMLDYALEEWRVAVRATTDRPSAITADEALDAIEALQKIDRIPTSWMDGSSS